MDSDADAAARSPREALLAALAVRRYARIALAAGAAFALGVTLLFPVALAGGRPARPAPLYLALSFVVFVTSALLALVVLVGRRVLHIAVHPASLVRRAGTVGLLAGAAWLAGAVALALGPAPLPAAAADLALPWAALLTPFGVWAAYTRYKRAVAAPRVAAAAALVALAGAVVVADLAAFDLVALLPDVGRGVDGATVRLFLAGLLALVSGHAALAGLAVPVEVRVTTPLALGGLPLAGLAGYLLAGPGRFGLAALAAGFGCCWLLVGWRLRGVSDDAVPTGSPVDVGSA